MNANSSNEKLNEIIDANNGIHGAIDSLNARIARRASEGKESPVAAEQLAAILALPIDYQTPKQIQASANWASSGGFQVG